VGGGGRRRRPSGERAPLQYELKRTGRVWLALGAVVVAMWVVLLASSIADPLVQNADDSLLRWFEAHRGSRLTSVATGVSLIGSPWLILALRWLTISVLAVYKRWRHLIAFTAIVITIRTGVSLMSTALGRTRPTVVSVIGHWAGYAHPSRPVATLSVTTIAMSFALLPKGRWRDASITAAAGAIAALGLAEVYLGVSHPSDVIAAAIVGVAAAVVTLRVTCPDKLFPISYRRTETAHLDLDARRVEAIKVALAEQLDIELLDLKKFGLAGSAGSTPLLLEVRDAEGRGRLFGKLYARSHLRSDRWYKLGRTILYGRLEDEAQFNSVRQLVEYEDYMLRVAHGAGMPTPKPYGFVELTPEREYLLVCDFLRGAEEIDGASMTDEVIDQGLAVVRLMWDEGIAHRDIKPSNVMVRDDKLYLVDVAFSQLRPSGWRQAVDLGNMMLVLALRSESRHVYERALARFKPEEVAEAFAATRGVTMPSGLRTAIEEDGRDLCSEFVALAPERAPIGVQRWSWRRVGVTLAAACMTAALIGVAVVNLANPGAI
jgi:tRNA A-37 threonylcarbamoyl transferase component Bud32/membrane-associated phospholipid phosphatase